MRAFKCSENKAGVAYSYRKEIEKELLKSLPAQVLATAQSGKVIRTAAGLLGLNLLQCSMLSWLLQRSHYGLGNLSSSAHTISLFEQDHNKQLLLLILLNAYYVKSFLNAQPDPALDQDLQALIPDFAKVYRTWRPDHTLTQATYAQLNVTFDSWTLPHRSTRPDYNQLVNKILELSKTYNVGGNEEDPPKKRRKHNEQPVVEQVDPEPQPVEAPPEDLLASGMRLRSCRGEDEGVGDLLRRSTRNRSFGYFNFDMTDSRMGFNHSLLRTESRHGKGEAQGGLRGIKLTTSYQQLR